MRRALPLIGLIVVYAKVVLTEAHLASLDSDEGMYSGAAWCVATGRTLYQDVVFTQTPGAAWLYAGLIKTSGYSLLGMRLLNGLFVLAIPTLVALIVQRYASGDAALRRRAGLVAFILIAFSDLFLIHNVDARNYASSLAFALAATLLSLEAQRVGRPVRALLVSAGLCLGLAVTFKHSMLVLSVPLLIILAARHSPSAPMQARRNLHGLACFVAGFVIGLLPTLWCAARAWDAFIFGTYRIHQLIAAWRIESHHPGTGVANKTWIWLGSIIRMNWVIAAPALVTLIAMATLRIRRIGSTRAWPARTLDERVPSSPATPVNSHGRLIPLAALEAILLGGLYFCLTPTWPDYATQVLPFLVIVAVAGLVQLFAPRIALFTLIAMTILAIAANPRSLDRLITRRHTHPSQLQKLSACGDWLRDHARANERVLCVFPPYLMAAGRDPTMELAGGITAMNIADRMPEPRRRAWKAMSQREMLDRLSVGTYQWVVTGPTTPVTMREKLASSHEWSLAAYWSGGLAVYRRIPDSDQSAVIAPAPP